MQELQIFNNEEFGQIRTVVIENEPYFVGKDVAVALGYKNQTVALQDNVDEEDKVVTKVSTRGGKQETTVINESGLYSLVFGSRLESAKKFKHWVTSEVLPTLRKTGSYEMPKPDKPKQDRTEIMMMNARSRMAQTYIKMAQVDTLSTTYKNVLISKASEVLAGERIIPLPVVEQKRAYSAREIGEMFGISANKVGRIANLHRLKTEPYGEYRRDKRKNCEGECDTWVYFDTAIPEFERIIGIEVA